MDLALHWTAQMSHLIPLARMPRTMPQLNPWLTTKIYSMCFEAWFIHLSYKVTCCDSGIAVNSSSTLRCFFLPQNQITLLHWAKHFRHSSIYDMCPYRYFLCVLVHQCPPNSNVQYLISWCGQVPPIWLADTQSSSANDYSSSKSGGGQTLNITVELHCSTVQADIIRLLGTLMYAFCNW